MFSLLSLLYSNSSLDAETLWEFITSVFCTLPNGKWICNVDLATTILSCFIHVAFDLVISKHAWSKWTHTHLHLPRLCSNAFEILLWASVPWWRINENNWLVTTTGSAVLQSALPSSAFKNKSSRSHKCLNENNIKQPIFRSMVQVQHLQSPWFAWRWASASKLLISILVYLADLPTFYLSAVLKHHLAAIFGSCQETLLICS